MTMLANLRIGHLRLRGEGRLRVTGPTADDNAAIIAEWSASERTDWRVELGYEASAHRARTAVGYTRRFRAFSLSAYGEAATDGSLAAGLSFSMGFGPDPRNGGVRFSRERMASQGQALATVFYDENADGIQQPGEETAQGVMLTAGNAVTETPTAPDGRAIVEALTPFRAVVIGIDESSLPNPLVRAASPGVVVVPRPGVVIPVALPLVAAGEVEGVLARQGGGSGIEGVDLELIDARGNVRGTTRSDFDGFFLFESVPYGHYQLRATALSAQAIGIAPNLAAVVIDRDHQRAQLGTLAVAARSDIARAPPTTGEPAASPAR